MRNAVSWTVACAVVFLAGRASAQEPEFGSPGHVAISAERLFGYVHSKETVSMAGMENSQSVDTLTLLTNPLGAITGYAWPRIGIDAFVTQGLSVGGALGFFYLDPEGAGSFTGFLFAPRIGYAAPLSPRLSIWPRAGVTYWSVSTETGTAGASSTQTAFALSIEAPLTILLAPRVGIQVGPTFDLGLGGSSSSTSSGGMSTSYDNKFTDFGVQGGLLLFL
jgi:hypothetical protein